MAEIAAPLIGVNRHRLTTDGKGVTTLVAFHGCPLRCRYCINAQCRRADGVKRTVTPQQLVDMLMVDNLYFLATDGGVTFGGGEPLLRSEFIERFRALAPERWRITLETSLNVDRVHLERLLPVVDDYIVDIKDMNPAIYMRYTGVANEVAVDNLRWLLSHDGMAERVTVRVPHIPGFNTAADVSGSIATLRGMGVRSVDEFNYKST